MTGCYVNTSSVSARWSPGIAQVSERRHRICTPIAQFQAKSARADQARCFVDQEIIPGLRQERGFPRLYVLVDLHTGEGMVVTIWGPPADEAASQSRSASASHGWGQSSRPRPRRAAPLPS